MKNFEYYLNSTEEIGFVEKSMQSITYISGLPDARPYEVVLFETGELGQVITLTPDLIEVLLLSSSDIRVGTKVARTGELLEVGVGEGLLGKTIDPLGRSYTKSLSLKKISETRPVDIEPPGILDRKNITQQLETGVAWVDLVIPIGKGQRQLVIGDRKTGKTGFLLQAIQAQALIGTVCVYAAIAKRRTDIKMSEELFAKTGIFENVCVVASSASDPAGLIFLTPYTAMTIAEYFRDKGKNVLIVLDDMTAHAKAYREVSLLARKFPGRSSYPGDIFFVQSRLLERAGNFVRTVKNSDGTLSRVENSITAFPVAELVMGDISGYIQTNLMAVTDGHILFDIDYYNQGRRPAINPFLSVTRVGHQTQSALMKDISRELSSFLVHLEKLRQYMHFGAELSEATRRTLATGDQILKLLEQPHTLTIPMNINAVILSALWAGFWKDVKLDELKQRFNFVIAIYIKDKKFKQEIDTLINSTNTFAELVAKIKENENIIVAASGKALT